MTMRPLLPGAAQGAVARARMAPGGRVKPFSQSPIPRAGRVRRVRTAGAAPAPTFVNSNLQTVALGESSVTHATPTAGELLVIVACAVSVTVSAPTGWTVADSGTSGDLSWVVAYTTAAAGTDYEVTATGTGFVASGMYGHIHSIMLRLTGTGVPTVDANLVADVVSCTPEPSSMTGAPSSFTFAVSSTVTGTASASVLDYAGPEFDAMRSTTSRAGPNRNHHCVYALPAAYDAAAFVGAAITGYEGASPYGELAQDWVSLGIGF